MRTGTDRQILLEPDLYLLDQAGRLVVIDQVQLMPELFTVLREQIDHRRGYRHQTGQFLLLGSASNALLHQSGELLAWQAVFRELSGVNLVEAGQGP